jgi:biopolymer transport protein ExbD
MAEKPQRTFDVWIIETNTVYRGVPYTVITDWVQQGRLLNEDRLRAAGTSKWQELATMPAFTAFLPRVEPHRANDQAEALEPVQLDIAWKHRPAGGEDEDVDMIPLIDVSLVLLVFFMMTATVSTAAATIAIPEARYMLFGADPEMWWIGIEPGSDGGEPKYSMAQGDKGKAEAFESRKALVEHLTAELQKEHGPVDIRIRAHRQLPYKYVRDMTADLGEFRRHHQIHKVMTEVSEVQNR